MVLRFSRVGASVCTALAEGDFVVSRSGMLRCGVIPLAEERVENLQCIRLTVFGSLSASKIVLNHWVHKSVPFSMLEDSTKTIGRDSPLLHAGIVSHLQIALFAGESDE